YSMSCALVLFGGVSEARVTTDSAAKNSAMLNGRLLIEVSKHRVQGIQPLKIHDEIIKTSERRISLSTK
ncbi:MAG: hypothetical protein WCC77_16235, partial [Pseudolabrys sp.]